MPLDDLKTKRNALLSAGERTLADVLDLIQADQALPSTRRRDMCSAIRRFCELVGREPALIMARIPDLQRPLAELTPGKAGLTSKTVANLRSNLLAALRGWGGVQSVAYSRKQLSPEWRALMASLTDKRMSDSLSRFSRFCSATGVTPGEVDNQTVERFMQAVREGCPCRKPKF